MNRRYAIARLQGVIAMLEDATDSEAIGFAIQHLSTVSYETIEAAQNAGYYGKEETVVGDPN